MKTIQTVLKTSIILTTLALSTSAASQQLRGSKAARGTWQISYDTARTCVTGRVVATVSLAANTTPRQGVVVFRVAGAGKSYTQTSSFKANGRATLTVPVKNAFNIRGQSSVTNFACTVQVGNGAVQKVACPVLPTCAVYGVKTLAPTESPTPNEIDVMAPTQSPTIIEGPEFLAPTESPTPNEIDQIAPTKSPSILKRYGRLSNTESPTPNDTDVTAPTQSPTPNDTELLAPTQSPTVIEGPEFQAPTESPTTDETDLLAPTSFPTVDEPDLLAPTSSPTQF